MLVEDNKPTASPITVNATAAMRRLEAINALTLFQVNADDSMVVSPLSRNESAGEPHKEKQQSTKLGLVINVNGFSRDPQAPHQIQIVLITVADFSRIATIGLVSTRFTVFSGTIQVIIRSEAYDAHVLPGSDTHLGPTGDLSGFRFFGRLCQKTCFIADAPSYAIINHHGTTLNLPPRGDGPRRPDRSNSC